MSYEDWKEKTSEFKYNFPKSLDYRYFRMNSAL